ncbi:MAG: hypothetical protein ABJQ84_02360, partial [Ekhidna sp.]
MKFFVIILITLCSTGIYAQPFLDGSEGIKFKPTSGDYNLIRSYNAEYEDLTFDTRYPLVFSTISTGAFEFINHLGTELFAIKGMDGTTYFKGDIGIGTTSPLEKLQIDNGTLQFLNIGANQDNIDIIKIGESTVANEFSLQGMFSGIGETGNAIKFRSMWKDNLLKIVGNGNIGLGTELPLEKLHVDNGALQFLNIGESQDNVDIIKIGESTVANEFSLQGMFNGTGETGNAIKFRSMWNDNLLIIKGNGQIGMGTLETGTHRLAVDGTIGAREIKVEAAGWSDYVFSKDYELRKLEDVEKHI